MPKQSHTTKRYPLSMRTTKEMREKVEKSATASGRSLAQEVEYRVTRSIEQDEAMGGFEIASALQAIGTELRRADDPEYIASVAHNLVRTIIEMELRTGAQIRDDLKTFATAEIMVSRAFAAFMPAYKNEEAINAALFAHQEIEAKVRSRIGLLKDMRVLRKGIPPRPTRTHAVRLPGLLASQSMEPTASEELDAAAPFWEDPDFVERLEFHFVRLRIDLAADPESWDVKDPAGEVADSGTRQQIPKFIKGLGVLLEKEEAARDAFKDAFAEDGAAIDAGHTLAERIDLPPAHILATREQGDR